MPVPDANIVKRVLGGDVEQFNVLVDRYYDRCVRLAYHIVGNTEDAEDVVQETFLRAYRSLANYEERERFAAWLYRILVNQCRTLLVRRKRGEVTLTDWERPSMFEQEAPFAETTVLREALAQAMVHLAPDQREAIVLKFSEGLTYDEMAVITGSGVSALKMRVQRACARLRALLQESTHV